MGGGVSAVGLENVRKSSQAEPQQEPPPAHNGASRLVGVLAM